MYKPNISTMYVKWSQDQCTRDNVSKVERKEKKRYINPHYIPQYTLSP